MIRLVELQRGRQTNGYTKDRYTQPIGPARTYVLVRPVRQGRVYRC